MLAPKGCGKNSARGHMMDSASDGITGLHHHWQIRLDSRPDDSTRIEVRLTSAHFSRAADTGAYYWG